MSCVSPVELGLSSSLPVHMYYSNYLVHKEMKSNWSLIVFTNLDIVFMIYARVYAICLVLSLVFFNRSLKDSEIFSVSVKGSYCGRKHS